LSVPAGFDQVSATQPYYRSTYVLVFPKGKGLDGVHSSDDLLGLPQEQVAKLRIGLYDRSPASQWLARHRMVDNGVPYQIMNADPAFFPGQDIERDLVSGKIDAAIVWGPIGGFFVKHTHTPELTVAPMRSEPNLQMEFSIAMGVRYGEPKWKAQVESLLARHAGDIQDILHEYAVPTVAIPPAAPDQDGKK
ncbi:MAG TPA: ABC transporter substrate-binding protein, partial [Burkholderiaceae bacterium]|jgi:ABC-type amino acid transport substrate-binding protein|nr:ABC transporter substrate-binding protein [Burkholderiaceae bacterium]